MTDVFPFTGYENHELWRAYLPHALRLMKSNNDDAVEAKAELALMIGQCLYEDGQISEAVIWLEQSSQWRERELI